jgi:hypothetical protein
MQLYVVRNPKTGAVFVFDNHDAALRSRIDQKLTQDFLIGCSLCSDWQKGQPIRKEDVPQ